MSTETDFDWLSLHDGESVVWTGQPRRKSVLKVAAAVLVGLVVVAAVELTYLVGALPLGALLVGWLYLRIVNTDYVLTDRSVYRRTGVAGETVRRASLAKVQNVDLSKGVLGTQFGFGTVEVSTAGGMDISLSGVDGADELKELVDEYAKRSEGVGIDAEGFGRGVDHRQVERLQAEAEQLREVAESLEETFTGGDA